jgi:hypothetical protein
MLTIAEENLNKIMDSMMRAQKALSPANNDEEKAAIADLIVAQSLIVAAKDGKASPELREAAERRILNDFHAEDEIEIDDEASVSHGNDGSFVSAWIWVPRSDDDDERAECANCGWTGSADDCGEIKDIFERVAAGEEMPAGECPECGCLCHLTDKEEA